MPHETDKIILPFQSTAIQELAWAILSPELIKTENPEYHHSERFYQDAYQSIETELLRQDTLSQTGKTIPLDVFLNQQPNQQRLGIHFEKLWLYWLNINPIYHCLAHNVPIRGEKKTLGEFDFIIKHLPSGEIEHWELAIKFYLGIPPLNIGKNWIGPNQKDRLEIKYQHLIKKQLPLSLRPEMQAYCSNNNWDIKRRRLICKGRLFHPFSKPISRDISSQAALPGYIHPNHLKGHWFAFSDFEQYQSQYPNARYQVLQKTDWMAPKQTNTLPFSLLKSTLPIHSLTFPIQLAAHNWQTNPTFIFLVPDHWKSSCLALST